MPNIDKFCSYESGIGFCAYLSQMKSNLVLVLTLLSFCTLYSQTVVNGKLLDAETKFPILYANIGIAHTGMGTISNADGDFRLEVSNATDTIVCSFIGYETLKVPASAFPQNGLLYLAPKAFSLATTVISANSFLYDVVSKCRSQKPQKSYTAKTYYALDSYMNGYPVEMLECYYNGQFSGMQIEFLKLKSGKIYLADYYKHYFTNLETSKAIVSMHILSYNNYFPSTPFELKRNKLMETYNLHLMDKFRDVGTIYKIAFEPKADSSRFFNGEVWIDSTTNSILKVHLQAKNAQPQPFLPFWEKDSITRVDLDIHQTFKRQNGQLFFDVVHFNYEMQYKDRNKQINIIQTNGIIRVYDLENRFILPFYEYDAEASDYRKISEFPYNDFFWQHRDSVLLTEKQLQDKQYFEKYGTVFNSLMLTPIKKTFFQDNNIVWSAKNRIHIKELNDSTQKSIATPTLPSSMYKLNVQLFLDINQTGDKIHTLTKTIFDVFDSYYRLPMDVNADCFANIYFDLVETQRLELEKEITKPNITVEEIQLLYKKRQEKLAELSNQYFREVERGQNLDKLAKWNKYVAMRLGIDNMALFGLKVIEVPKY